MLVQTYHEEMLEKSPRREFLNKYAHQLLLRYPSLRDQVHLRMQRLHSQWQVVEATITPNAGDANTDSMMQGTAHSHTHAHTHTHTHTHTHKYMHYL